MTGKILFPSLLRHRAAGELAELLAEDPVAVARYRKVQQTLRDNLAPTFGAPGRIRGWLQAATEVGRQPDVWGSLYALHLGILPPAARDTLLGTVADAVRRGTIAYQGAVRHVPTDFDAGPTSAWERTGVKLNTYQNGAYWHTPTGWLIKALERKDAALAAKVTGEFIRHLRQVAGAPWECFAPGGYAQNPAYMTSVTVPLAVLATVPTRLEDRTLWWRPGGARPRHPEHGLNGRELGPPARRSIYIWSAEEALTRLRRSW